MRKPVKSKKPKSLKTDNIFCRECGHLWIQLNDSRVVKCPECGIMVNSRNKTKGKQH